MRHFRFTSSATTKGTVHPNTWRRFGHTAPARFTAGLLARCRKLIFRLRSQLFASATLPPHLRLGKKGESAAARFLKKESFKILYHNFKARSGGEIDLVCRDRKEQILVFVEVKTRTNELFGPPHD